MKLKKNLICQWCFEEPAMKGKTICQACFNAAKHLQEENENFNLDKWLNDTEEEVEKK